MHDDIGNTLRCARRAGGLLGLALLAACGGGSGSEGSAGGAAAAPVLASVEIPDGGLGVLVRGQHAYVAAGDAGLRAYDVADPSTLAFTGDIDTASADNASGGMDTFLDNVYYAGGTQGAHHADLADPASPAYRSTVSSSGSTVDVTTTPTTQRLCLANGDFHVAQLGGPDQATVALAEATRGVAATERYCYVTAGTSGGTGTGNPVVYVINVTHADAPTLADTFSLPSGTPAGIDILGDHAYVAAGDPGMFVIDISDRDDPVIVGQTGPLPATGALALDAGRMRAYLAMAETLSEPGGIKIVDITNASAPAVVGTADLPDTAGGIDAADGNAYVATFDPTGPAPSRFHAVDVSAF